MGKDSGAFTGSGNGTKLSGGKGGRGAGFGCETICLTRCEKPAEVCVESGARIAVPPPPPAHPDNRKTVSGKKKFVSAYLH